LSVDASKADREAAQSYIALSSSMLAWSLVAFEPAF
jgi:hypothetical protein